MPYIDDASSEDEANRLLRFYAAKIKRLGATDIAGVELKKQGNKWYINLDVYVSRSSNAFKEFMKNFQ